MSTIALVLAFLLVSSPCALQAADAVFLFTSSPPCRGGPCHGAPFTSKPTRFSCDVCGLTHPLLASRVSPTLTIVRLSNFSSGEVAPRFVGKVAKFASRLPATGRAPFLTTPAAKAVGSAFFSQVSTSVRLVVASGPLHFPRAVEAQISLRACLLFCPLP
jgi:hypothetical protein